MFGMAKFFFFSCCKPYQKPQHPGESPRLCRVCRLSGCGCPNWLVGLRELGKCCLNHLSKARM